MEINILRVKISNEWVERRDIPKIRGFVAGVNPNIVELHNHLKDDKFNYGYPTIQYKSISGEPYIIALGDSNKKLIEAVYELGTMNIGGKEICTNEKAFFVERKEFGIDKDLITYKFLSPWMALNQSNYKGYLESDQDGKNSMLKKILIGNILSMSKKMDYRVEEEIKVFLKLNSLKVNFKNNEMLAFNGEFLINFKIPDFLGIGKSVSRGFGTVEKVNGKQFV